MFQSHSLLSGFIYLFDRLDGCPTVSNFLNSMNYGSHTLLGEPDWLSLGHASVPEPITVSALCRLRQFGHAPWTEVARRGFSRGVQGQGEGVAKRRGWMQGGQNPSEGFLGEECIESGRLGISVQGPKTPE